MKNINEYILNVKSQLVCNTSDEYKSEHVTYNYTNETIDHHLDYFKKCMYNNLSSYKALLYFYDYLNDEYNLPN